MCEQKLKSDFLEIPRIGVQDGKIEIPQTLSQQSPLETILENTRLSSFDLIFSKIIIFFKFSPSRGLPIKSEFKDSTVLAIAHRLDTLILATNDVILIIETANSSLTRS